MTTVPHGGGGAFRPRSPRDKVTSVGSQQPGLPILAMPGGELRATVDVVLGAAVAAATVVAVVARLLEPGLARVWRVALHPPLVPARLQLGHWLEASRRVGAEQRPGMVAGVSRMLDWAVPRIAEDVLSRLDLTELVIDFVDLDRVVSAVDIDQVADRMDLDAVAGRLDVDGVAQRIDIAAILDRLDLTETVLHRVDLATVVAAALDTVDLPALATGVIDTIDLPEIIRESTGSMASETVRGVRMQGIAADETVTRIVARLLARRSRP